jgi:hypothetical protein
MVAKSGKRNLLVSASIGAVPVTRLKNLTTGRLYLRPLQKSISNLDTDSKHHLVHCNVIQLLYNGSVCCEDLFHCQ